MKNLNLYKNFIDEADGPGFWEGVGMVFDIGGTGVDFPFCELVFQPTAVFGLKPETPPGVQQGFPADRKALLDDWQAVGNDFEKVINEYRKVVGAWGAGTYSG